MPLLLNDESAVIDITAKGASSPLTTSGSMGNGLPHGSQQQQETPTSRAALLLISANSSELGDCHVLCGFVLENLIGVARDRERTDIQTHVKKSWERVGCAFFARAALTTANNQTPQ